MSVSLGDKVRSGILWSAVRSWGSRLAGFLVFLVLARLLTPAQFGVFAAATAFLALMELFVDQGMGDALVQRKEISDRLINSVFLINIFFGVAVVITTFFAAPLVASTMKMPQLTAVLQLASLGVLINAFSLCQQALYRRELKYKFLAIRTLTATLVSGASGCAAAYFGLGVWALVIQFLLMCVLNAALVWRYPIWRFTRQYDWLAVRPLAKYGANIFLIRLLDFMNTRFIEFFIGFFLGAVSLGIYSVGSRLYQILMQMLSSVVLDVAHSGFSKMRDDLPAMREAYYKALKLTAVLVVPILVGVAALAEPLCVLFFGKQWHSSGSILTWLALLGAIQVMQYYNGSCLNALGLPSITFRISLLKVIFSTLVMFLMAGTEISEFIRWYVFAQILVAPLSFYYGWRYIQFDLKAIVFIIVKAILIGGLIFLLTYLALDYSLFEPIWLNFSLAAFVWFSCYLIYLLLNRSIVKFARG